MNSYLVARALQDLWCAPQQDLQAIIKPARICPKDGVWNRAKIMWNTYKLPVQRARFYVYQLGQINPYILGVLDTTEEWVRFDEVCNKENLIVDLYDKYGTMVPRNHAWYMITSDRNVVVAVMQHTKIPINLHDDSLYVRFYSNAYFNAQRNNPDVTIVNFYNGVPKTSDEIIALQNQFEILQQKPGAVWGIVNGMIVDKVDLFNVSIDDHVEIVYDASVKRIIKYDIAGLDVFESTLDQERKYLLHYNGAGPTTIDYFDDIDFYVVKNGQNGRYKGALYHRNKEKAVRMLTHRDYSMPVSNVLAYGQHWGWDDMKDCSIVAFVRHGGWNRTLIDENNRIKELYKLTDADIRGAMVGVNSLVHNWKAATLEASEYTQIMRAYDTDIFEKLVLDAYGYNATAKLLGNTPSRFELNSDQKICAVPHGLVEYSTGYEYDASGKLLGWNNQLYGNTFIARFGSAEFLEQLSGLSDSRLDEVYGEKETTLTPGVEYRCYACDIIDGVPTNKWVDVTGSGKYSVINNKLTWHVDQTRVLTLVRGDSINYVQLYNLNLQQGVLEFSITHRVLRNGIIQEQVMQIPMGTLDVFMNGRKLIRGLDYYVKFPRIVIVNKDYLYRPGVKPQEIVVRCQGFCDANFNIQEAEDFGFISHGVVSRDKQFDIRDDKVQRIFVGGLLRHRDSLKFAENGITPDAYAPDNGKPFIVEDVFVPFRDIPYEKTTQLQQASKAIDKAVSDYLTLKLPETVIDQPSVSTRKYPVYSPFLSRLISDLNDGTLSDPRLKQQYGTQLVTELCADYEYLLAFDPTTDANTPNLDFVVLHPHYLNTIVSVDIYAMKFIRKVNDHYLQNRIDLSQLLKLI